MKLIDRYLFRQLVIPTLLALAALTTVAFLSQSLSALDLIVEQRQGMLVFLKATLLALPQLVSAVLPVAIFVAAVMALNRMHTEHEIVVCFAGGMSSWNVISPALRIAAGAALVSLILNLWIAPPASQALRREIFRARADLAASLVQPGEFTHPAPGLTVYAQSVSADGQLKNLFVHQQRDQGSTTFNAQSGQITKRAGAPVLLMWRGSSQEMTGAGVLNYLSFDEYSLDLSSLLKQDEAVHFKTSDRYLHELVFPDLTQAWEQQYRGKMLSEAHSRLASPLYNLAFMAIALAAVVGGAFSRLGYAGRIGAGSVAAALARIAGFTAQALAIHNDWLNLFQYIIPVGMTFAALSLVLRRGPGPARVQPPGPLAALAGVRA